MVAGGADDDGHRVAGIGEEHRRLSGRVPAADDDHRFGAALAPLHFRRRVVHARVVAERMDDVLRAVARR